MTLSPVHRGKLCAVQGTAWKPPSDPPLLSISSPTSFLPPHWGSGLHAGLLSLGLLLLQTGLSKTQQSHVTALLPRLRHFLQPSPHPASTAWQLGPSPTCHPTFHPACPAGVSPGTAILPICPGRPCSRLTPLSPLGSFPISGQSDSPVFTRKHSWTKSPALPRAQRGALTSLLEHPLTPTPRREPLREGTLS